MRGGSNTTHLEPFGVRIVRGSLADLSFVLDAMHGADAVVHTAGNTSCNRRDLPALVAANVDATKNVVEAALATRIRRLVYTSTTSTIGATAGAERPADETTPLRGFRARSPYAMTKLEGERIVLGSARPRPRGRDP